MFLYFLWILTILFIYLTITNVNTTITIIVINDISFICHITYLYTILHCTSIQKYGVAMIFLCWIWKSQLFYFFIFFILNFIIICAKWDFRNFLRNIISEYNNSDFCVNLYAYFFTLGMVMWFLFFFYLQFSSLKWSRRRKRSTLWWSTPVVVRLLPTLTCTMIWFRKCRLNSRKQKLKKN